MSKGVRDIEQEKDRHQKRKGAALRENEWDDGGKEGGGVSQFAHTPAEKGFSMNGLNAQDDGPSGSRTLPSRVDPYKSP